jgi:hypothetical protein
VYRWLVYIHVLAAFAFLLAHGTSAAVAFRLRSESERSRLGALLDLSAGTQGAMYICLLAMLVAGIILGFMGRWWGMGWIWTSLLLLVLTAVGMYVRASLPFHRIRQAAGLAYFDGRRAQPAGAPAAEAVLKGAVAAVRPAEVAGIGLVPIAIILWLMMFKPF